VSSALDNNYKAMHVDYASYLNGAWYISGWLLSQTEKPQIKISLENNSFLTIYYNYFERSDLVEALGLVDETCTNGFVLVVETFETDFLKLTFTIDNKHLKQDMLHPEIIDSPDIILAALGTKQSLFVDSLPSKIVSSLRVSTSEEKAASLREVDTLLSFSYYLDNCFVTDSNLFYLTGWALLNNNLNDIFVTDDKGESYSVTECFRYIRKDINVKFNLSENTAAGFVCACRLPDGFKPEQMTINIPGYKSITSEIEYGKVHLSKAALLKDYLAFIDVHNARFLDNAQPAVLRHIADIWQAESIMNELSPRVGSFGELNSTPQVSIIIPIYGRYDFVQHQLLAFSNDSDMQNHEIIYVLDDPRIEREFNIACHGVFNTFNHPFKTIHAGKNLGFAGANNLGASIATGKYILALNSDVLPSDHGWVGRLAEKFTTLDSPGILGTKLVYEDETIQHIGMTFQDDAYYPGIWMNYHPHKGMPSHLINKKETELTELVTGACMLMEKEFFISVGGFDTRYILGDFEDSDLCMKAYQHNKKIYIDTQESLYHLERLSQNLVDSGDWKYKLTLLNGLYQKTKWDDAIKKVKQQNV